VLSLALSLPAFLESFLRSSGNATLWIAWAGTLMLLWSSWPRYRSRLLRAATYGLSALVVLNVVASTAVAALYGEHSPTLAPNLDIHLHFVDRGVAPGIGLDQIVTTNAYGHRTNGPIDYRHKPPDVLRLVAIGASTTEEHNLDDHKTWTSLTAKALASATGRKVEVINTALSGVRAEHNYRALLDAEAYAPDIVTFLMGINDWNQVVARQQWSPLHRFLSRLSAMTFGNSLLYRGLKQLSGTIQLGLHQAGLGGGRMVLEDDGAYTASSVDSLARPKTLPFHPTAVDADYARWVGRIFDECRSQHIFCLFMDQPTAYSASTPAKLRKRLWMTPPFADYTLSMDDMIHLSRLYNDWLAQAVKSSGLAFCPLADKIPATTDYLIDDCHFNENGAQRVAEIVSGCLIDHRAAFDRR
jgi:lysophospholipase L1-like esterase